MEMIYSAAWADFELTKSLQCALGAMVFVYNLALADEAPQRGPSIHFSSFWGSG
eukprot:CAMPEP_0194576356 /NCGR_PEP_ID=MMETSP0292-20121207/11506_1 /TAXON_ID=39354 /ORGANISM="Heterosigma akashiwo, Strain CCMP2393" /LENGTH=53 /DNA_ID=CAMNT_0039428393 /DNA_START=44 /DNA_END=205 /DNA_ORIENTATION=+